MLRHPAPTGIVAACGLVALKTMVNRLAEDHQNAHLLAEGLSQIPGLKIDPKRAQTNMVFVDISQVAKTPEFHRLLLAYKVEALVQGETEFRLVTHRHIGRAQVEQAIDAFRNVTSQLAQ